MINPKKWFFKFNMGAYGNFLRHGFFKISALHFLMKISRIGPLNALNKMA
jgi:hypothetical protein